VVYLAISFAPMRQYMKDHKISYYYLGNQGIESPTLHRIRHDEPITTETLDKLCKIMKCQPADLLEYRDDDEGTGGK
jgi:putative transcriptional regulator